MARPIVELFAHGESMHVTVEPPSEIGNVRQHLQQRFETFVHPLIGDVSAHGNTQAIENHLGKVAVITGVHQVKPAPVVKVSL